MLIETAHCDRRLVWLNWSELWKLHGINGGTSVESSIGLLKKMVASGGKFSFLNFSANGYVFI